MPATPLTQRLIADGLKTSPEPDVPAIWQAATDAQFAEFMERLTVRDPTIRNAVREAAPRLRGRKS